MHQNHYENALYHSGKFDYVSFHLKYIYFLKIKVKVHYISVGQKLAMLKICSTSVTFLSLRNIEAAPEEAMQLRRLIKSSNESLGLYLFGKSELWNF